MTLTKSIQTVNTEFLNTNQSERPVSPDLEVTPSHLNYISGKKGTLYKELCSRKKTNAFGALPEHEAALPLPALNEEEMHFIQDDLVKEFGLDLGPGLEPYPYSIERILKLARPLLEEAGYQLVSVNAIGEYVNELLFNHTNYSQRVFELLNIGDLYDPGYFRKSQSLPEIQLRCYVRRKNPIPMNYGGRYFLNYELNVVDIKKIRDLMINALSSEIIKERGLKNSSLYPEIWDNAFSTICTITSESNLFQLMTFKTSGCELIFFNHLVRPSFFTLDDIYIPLAPLLFGEGSCLPSSFRGSPRQTYMDGILGCIRADFPQTLNEKGWLQFLTCKTQGNFSAQLCNADEFPLDAYLFGLAQAKWLSEAHSLSLELLNSAIQKWLNKHYSLNPAGRLAFLLNASFYLQHTLPDEAISQLIFNCIGEQKFQGDGADFAIATLLYQLSCKDQFPLPALSALLQIACFLIHTTGSSTYEKVRIEIATENFEVPMIQLNLSSSTISLPCHIIDSLDKIVQFTHLKDFPAREADLAELFFLLSPPTAALEKIDEDKVSSLGVSFEQFYNSIIGLLGSPSPFINYVGLLLFCAHPNIEPEIKRKTAEGLVLKILTFFPDPKIKEQLEGIVGTIPDLEEAHFKEQWIWSLFAPERDSLEVGYLLWKEMTDQGEGRQFSFKLIPYLAESEPQMALQLFNYLHYTANLFASIPNDSVDFILTTGNRIGRFPTITPSHERFMESMGKTLCELLQNPYFKKPQVKEFERDLRLFAKWFKKHGDRTIMHDLFKIGRANALISSIEVITEITDEPTEEPLASSSEIIESSEQTYKRNELFNELQSLFSRFKGEEALNLITPLIDETDNKEGEKYRLALQAAENFIRNPQFGYYTKFNLINLLSDYEPAISPVLTDAVLAMCLSFDQTEEGLKSLILMVVGSSFFMHIQEREGFHELVRDCVLGLLGYYVCEENSKSLASAMQLLLTRYPKDTCLLTMDNWADIFELMRVGNPEGIIPMYELAVRETLFDPTQRHSYLAIYSLYILRLCIIGDSKLIDHLKDSDKLDWMCSSPEEPKMVFGVLTDLINGTSSFAKEDPGLIPHLRSLYQKIEVCWGLVERENDQAETKNDCYPLRAFADLSFVHALLAVKRKSCKSEVKALMKEIMEKKYPSSYWIFFGKIINLLSRDSTLKQFDALEEVIDFIRSEDIAYSHVLSFVEKHLTPGRSYIGLKVWKKALRNNTPITTPFWNQGYQFIKCAMNSNSPHFEPFIVDILTTFSNQHDNINEKIPHFDVQYIELVLLYLGIVRNPIMAKMLIEKLNLPFNVLPNLASRPGGNEVVKALPKALCNCANFDAERFDYYALKFWKIVTVKSSRTGKMSDKLLLSVERCLEIKVSFITTLLQSVQKQNPHNELILKCAATCLADLKKDRVLGKKQKEIKLLDKLFGEAKKLL